MSPLTFRILIPALLLGRALLSACADVLNRRHAAADVPAEFRDTYDADRYARSQRYLQETTRLDLAAGAVETAVVLAILLAGGFGRIDRLVRGATPWWLMQGLLFVGLLAILQGLLSLPFEAWRTFRVEQRFGFNRTTLRTFILDRIKGLLLAVVLGGPLLALVLWSFERFPGAAWIGAWGVLVVFQAIVLFIAPFVIMPLFNRFSPLPDGPTRDTITAYARRMGFAFKGVFTMDGSRRSSKANAFFTGFGASRRIVLFDTLVDRYPPAEAEAVVAHELGHYRLHHILKAMLRSAATTAAMMWLLSLVMKNTALSSAFGIPPEHVSVHSSLVFFGMLATPLGLALGIFENAVSRRQEYAADRYAVTTANDPGALIPALKRLAADSLANLTPHPLKVWLSYGHPPLADRIRAIRARLDER